MEKKLFKLENTIQNYAWGTMNNNAFIPKLLNMVAKKDLPYAELWIGNHPKAPSKISDDESYSIIDDLIQADPDFILGREGVKRFHTLPFLLKVLSAGSALSIQAHPNKNEARLLHEKDPEHYPDDNHKPEIAIALDQLTALCGFLPFSEMKSVFLIYPEITEFIGEDMVNGFISQDNPDYDLFFKPVFSVMMAKSESDKPELLNAIEKLKLRLQSSTILSKKDKIFLELEQIYPNGDIGLFSIFLLNLLELNSGEGVYIDAGIPHAYLKGNIIECMANSDNVVRAGLTPKFKDIDTLTAISTYKGVLPEIIRPRSSKSHFTYETPAEEFLVSKHFIQLHPFVFETNAKLNIIIFTEGKGKIKTESKEWEFSQGDSFIIPGGINSINMIPKQSTCFFAATFPE